MPNILIRTDIGAEHGMGHGRRCFALAQTLETRGASVSFITSTPALQAFVAPFVCTVVVPIPGEHVAYSLQNGRQCTPYTLVVDTKAAEMQDIWFYRDTKATGMVKIVRIDHPHATADSCDLLIGPCAHWSPETLTHLQQSFGARFLYGWDYVMLSPDVTQQEPVPYAARQPQIVFCAGGSDPSGALEKMWEWGERSCRGVRKVFCLGAEQQGTLVELWRHARHTGQGPDFYNLRDAHIVGPQEYQPSLHNASLVVSTFGQTCYEAHWHQTPMLILGQTDENCEGALRLAETGTGQMYMGDLRTIHSEQFCQGVQGVWEDPVLRSWMHGAARQHFLDGRGVERVADAIMAL